MDRQDDPDIAGEVVLYRRIPPYGDRVTWDENGVPTPSSFNFKDKDDELSLHISSETNPDRVLAGHDGFGLVHLTAGRIREICQSAVIICRDLEDPAEGHVLVCGKITSGPAKRLALASQWVEGKWPRRPGPDPDLLGVQVC